MTGSLLCNQNLKVEIKKKSTRRINTGITTLTVLVPFKEIINTHKYK